MPMSELAQGRPSRDGGKALDFTLLVGFQEIATDAVAGRADLRGDALGGAVGAKISFEAAGGT